MAQNTGKWIIGNILYDYDNNLKYELTEAPRLIRGDKHAGNATLLGFIEDKGETSLVADYTLVGNKDKTQNPDESLVNDYSYSAGYLVTKIKENAFKGNEKLTSVDLSKIFLLDLGSSAFENCKSLADIKFGSVSCEIGDNAFRNTGFTSFTIPEGVTAVGKGAFSACANLETIEIYYTVTAVGDEAFKDCTKLTNVRYKSTTSHPVTLNSFGDACFMGCKSLPNIYLPGTLTSLGSSCFSGCTALTNHVAVPASITELPNSCFENSGLTTIAFSAKKMKSFGDACFKDCANLHDFEIPEGLEQVGKSCFYGCDALTDIVIPTSITTLPNYCFAKSGLVSITLSNVSSIGDACFSECEKLTPMALPNTLTAIGSGSFSSCSQLDHLDFPASLETLGENCFESSGLTSITLPGTLKEIGEDCFRNCGHLSKVTFADDFAMDHLSVGMFSNCDALTEITIPSCVKTLGADCFSCSI